MLADFVALFDNEILNRALHVIVLLWPIWATALAIRVAFHLWLSYIHQDWINKQGSVFLEVRLPREVAKSPAAMELVLNGFWESSGAGHLADAFWEGKLRPWFSLEIVSIGGEVKFFIWALSNWKRIIESRIYAQYPEAQVLDAVDYARALHYDPDKISMFGVTTKLNKADAYPIKTYVEYELDKGNKEQEEIIDPITPVLEYLGSLKPGEVAGIQILIRANKKEGLIDSRLVVKPDWKGGVKEEVKKIIENEAPVKAEKDKPPTLMALTDEQKETIKAIERNAGKLAFDSMIRLLYVAPKDIFDKTKLMGLIGSMRQFGSDNLNGIRPDKFMSVTYPWQDFREMRKRNIQSTHIDAYKRRSFFNVPYKNLNGKPYVLTTEELATLFHFPGLVATTPTLSRAPSKRAEAPANLPV
ncbi:hypothetical protein KW784_01230 [Candidatus Parcubacteria bacterium]|nr:hypothetical protein [Candidatus Parcubacteria bacterium]